MVEQGIEPSHAQRLMDHLMWGQEGISPPRQSGGDLEGVPPSSAVHG